MARSRPSSVSSQASTSYPVLLLTLLPLTLAAFALVLQWRGGFNDSISLSSSDHRELPGMDTTNSSISSSKSFGCKELSGRSHYPSFPYYRNWKFNFQSDLRPKVSFDSFFFSISGILRLYFISLLVFKFRFDKNMV